MHVLCDTYNLVSLNKALTCFKNPVNPSCIDMILTNRPGCFMCTKVMETGLSDHHKKPSLKMESQLCHVPKL